MIFLILFFCTCCNVWAQATNQIKTTEEIYCTHPQVCRLIKNLNLISKDKKAIEIKLGVNLHGDSHEYSPGTMELKELIYAPVLVLAPIELAHWQHSLELKRSNKNSLITLNLDLHTEGSQKIISTYLNSTKSFPWNSLAHFWLYPELYCYFKNLLATELENKAFAFSKTKDCEIGPLNKNLSETFKKVKKYIFILGHDALVPLFNHYNTQAISIRSSDEHTEVNTTTIKKLSTLLKSNEANKIVWIKEDGIITASWIEKKYLRPENKIIKINVEGGLATNDEFHELIELMKNLNKLSPLP